MSDSVEVNAVKNLSGKGVTCSSATGYSYENGVLFLFMRDMNITDEVKSLTPIVVLLFASYFIPFTGSHSCGRH